MRRLFLVMSAFLLAVPCVQGTELHGYPSSPIFSGIIKAGSAPTTLTDTTGKILVNSAVTGVLPPANGGAPGAGIGNPTSTCIIEEFFPGSSSSATIGTHGWVMRNLVAACTLGYSTAAWPNFGQFTTTTPGVVTQGCTMELDSGGAGVFGDLSANINWQNFWVTKLSATTEIRARWGIITPAAGAAIPAAGYYLRYDTSVGIADTNFMYCVVSGGGAENCTSSGVAANTSFHTLKITSSVAGTITFTLDAANSVCITSAGSGCTVNNATLSTASLTMGATLVDDTTVAATKALTHDYASFCAQGLAR